MCIAVYLRFRVYDLSQMLFKVGTKFPFRSRFNIDQAFRLNSKIIKKPYGEIIPNKIVVFGPMGVFRKCPLSFFVR